MRDVKRALALIEGAGGTVEWGGGVRPGSVKARCPDGHEVFVALAKDSRHWICRYINAAGSCLRWNEAKE